MEFPNEFALIAAVMLVATLGGVAAILGRQPLIVAFIGIGVLVGPVGLGWVEPGSDIVLLSDLGIAVLLFLVGLKLDLHLIRTTGKVAVVTGLGQVIFTSVIGYGLALLLGLDPLSALYVAVALTFSSTIIIVKLLSDKRELDEPHGRIAVGFLIVQDIVVVLVMIGLSAFVGQDASLATTVGLVVAKGALFLGGIVLFARFVLPRALPTLARSHELLVLAAIGFAAALASIGYALGFSREVGAFLAGVTLASTGYRDAIGARLVSLRDFLLLFFFIDLGSRVVLDEAGSQLFAAIVLSAFVLIGNPLIVMVLMGFLGYRRKVGFLAGLTVAQISEFSFVLAALGLSLGHITSQTVSLVTVVGLITIGLSTYLILYSYPLFARLSPYLTVFERRSVKEHPVELRPDVDALVLGAGRYGSRLSLQLQERGLSVLAVDHDPQRLAKLEAAGVGTVYGDFEEPELLSALPLHEVQVVVCTVPQREAALLLHEELRGAGFDGHFLATAHHREDTAFLRQSGVPVVLEPFATAAADGADLVSGLLQDSRPPDETR